MKYLSFTGNFYSFLVLIGFTVTVGLPVCAQNSYTFTNCGATGRYGPTQLQVTSAYASGNLSLVATTNATSGIQTWTVPVSGAYRISAYGAQGGTESINKYGGRGAVMSGDFIFTSGQVLKILVGQQGGATFTYYGGGGGSFVATITNSPLCIAGGGGGAGGSSGGNGVDAVITTSGTAGVSGGTGGIGGNGGGAVSTNAGSGGGFYTNGTTTGLAVSCGSAFVNGGTGGQNSSWLPGGFGGGGCGWSSTGNGGGGGGYSGGGTSGSSYTGGGGGGSYNVGTNQTNSAGVNTGHGKVIISPICINASITPVTSLGNLPSVCLGNSATLTTNAVNNFTWSTGSTNTAIVVSPTLNTGYSVIFVSGTCVTSAVVTLSVQTAPPTLLIANSGSNSICSGQSVTISATGANSYSWTGGIINGVPFNPPVTSTYSVSAENSCGTVIYSTSVNVNQTPAVSVSNGSICIGQSFTLSPSGASTYSFSSGSNIVSPSVTTTYSVTGTSSAGCVASNTAISTIIVFSLPVVSVNSGSICAGNIFTVNPSGANSYVINGGSFTVSPASNTSYSVIGTSAVGCISSSFAIANVTVQAIPVLSVNNGTICSGGVFSMSPTGAVSYTFSSGTSAVSPPATTSYSIRGTSSIGCISNPVVSTVTVFSLPIITISGPTLACSGSIVSFTALGAATYTWNNSFTGPVFLQTPTAAVNSTVIGKDINGCLSSAQKSISTIPIPTLTASGGATVCQGVPLNLSVNGSAISYTWSPVTGGSGVGNLLQVTPSVTTIYTVTGTALNNCTNSSTVTAFVNQLPLVIAMASNTNICAGESVLLYGNGAGIYTWSGGVIDSIPFFPNVSSNYNVTGIDANGCKNTATVKIDVSDCTGIKSLAVDAAILVYPNPFIEEVTIATGTTGSLRAELVNSLSQVVGKFEITDRGKMNLSDSPSGIYILNLYHDGRLVHNVKLLKVN